MTGISEKGDGKERQESQIKEGRNIERRQKKRGTEGR